VTVRFHALARLISTDTFPAPVPTPLQHAAKALTAVATARAAVPSYATFATSEDNPFLTGPTTGDATAGYAQDLTTRLLAGKAMPKDLLDAAHQASVQDAKLRAADAVLVRTTRDVEAAFDRIATDHADALHDALWSRLQPILQEASATVDELDGYDVNDPSHLVTAREEIRSAYARLPEHVAAYDEIRTAHHAIYWPMVTALNDREFWSMAERAGWFEIRDVPSLWPQWQTAEPDRPYAAPWPTDPRARLVTVLELRPWLPTPGQVALAINEATQPTYEPVVIAGAVEKRERRDRALASARSGAPAVFFDTGDDAA
jgi:hypothetical protein